MTLGPHPTTDLAPVCCTHMRTQTHRLGDRCQVPQNSLTVKHCPVESFEPLLASPVGLCSFCEDAAKMLHGKRFRLLKGHFKKSRCESEYRSLGRKSLGSGEGGEVIKKMLKSEMLSGDLT